MIIYLYSSISYMYRETFLTPNKIIPLMCVLHVYKSYIGFQAGKLWVGAPPWCPPGTGWVHTCYRVMFGHISLPPDNSSVINVTPCYYIVQRILKATVKHCLYTQTTLKPIHPQEQIKFHSTYVKILPQKSSDC